MHLYVFCTYTCANKAKIKLRLFKTNEKPAKLFFDTTLTKLEPPPATPPLFFSANETTLCTYSIRRKHSNKWEKKQP